MFRRSMGPRGATFAGSIVQKLAAAAALGIVALGLGDRAAAGPLLTGQFGAGNTWNVYESIATPFTFKQALAFAATRPDPTGGSAVGHLLTVQSVDENNTIHVAGGGGDRWIGLTDRVGVAPGASESAFGLVVYNEGWAWVTGEPFDLEDPVNGPPPEPAFVLGLWGRDAAGVLTEPNNAAPSEDGVHIRGDSRWNDNASGFGLNDPVEDNITFDSPAEGEATMGFIIEWETQLTSEPPGFPMSRPDPGLPRLFPTPLARLPGPDGTASAWGARDVTGLGASGGTRSAINKVLSGGGTPIDGSLSMFAFRDPETNGTTPIAGAAAVPFVSNTTADDNNFQTVVKGTIVVPAGQGGDYTFNVRSDDGFAMRIISQATPTSPLTQHKFTSARTGVIDEDGTLAFLAPTGDSNTQGVVNLAPGTYDVEFLMFEDGGGAFGEVSTAKGNFVNPAPGSAAQWVLLGDPATRPQVGPFAQPARLTGNVAVKNYDRGTITNVSQIVTQFRSGATPTAEGSFEEVVIYDGDDLCCGRPGGLLPTSFLNEFPNLGNDQFTTAVTGQFQVLDTDGAAGETLTFGLFADDNAGLHIIGQSFTAVADFSPDGAAALINPEGGADQWLVADYRTGNTNAFGVITLQEGVNYNFEAFQLEEGGDSGLEVFVAAGNQLATGFNGAQFFPLSAAALPDQFLAANTGLGLVLGPGTGPSGGALDGDYNNDGKVDAADYVVWRKSNINGAAGYTTWRTNFGRTAGSGSAFSAVPEPASGLLVVLGIIGGAFAARRRAA